MTAVGRIAVLGAGKMGEALLSGLLTAGVVDRTHLRATVRQPARQQYIADTYGITVSLDNRDTAAWADVIVICVKPQTVPGLLREIRPVIAPRHLVISIAASVPIAFIQEALGADIPIIRAMPNVACMVREGMTVLAPGSSATHAHLAIARRIFDAVGRTMVLDERWMDAVTGLSASGPAFIYIIIESLAEAGVKVGLSREVATELVAQTVLGAAKMVLSTREHPAKLKDAVTTPAGCTIDGILELEAGGVRVTLIKAVVRATERARELFHMPRH